jgi:hypothetical protein
MMIGLKTSYHLLDIGEVFLYSSITYSLDPFQLSNYLQDAVYLPDLDNAHEVKNQTYKDNVLSVQNFVMSYSHVDIVRYCRYCYLTC